MKTIAVIGTGIMGSGIASNYLKHGYTVFVWNRSSQKSRSLARKGAISVGTPKEAALRADIVFEVTADDSSSRSVWLGKNGILAGARKDTVLISSGTFSLRWIDELAKICRRKKLSYFDMPLTGSRQGAEKGQLVLLVEGDRKKLERLKPDLKAVSIQVLHFGGAGAGARYKLLLNMLLAIHGAAFIEALKIAKKGRMNIQKVGDALAERPGGAITNLVWNHYRKPPHPINFSTRWMQKDMRYAKKFAGSLGTPLLDQVIKKYAILMKKGLAEKDWTVAIKDT